MRLEALETLIPDTRIPAAQIIAAAGGTPDEVQGFRQLFGMDSVAMADPAHGAMGYLADLLGRLTPFDPSQGPVALFHAHSLPMRADQRLTTAPKVQAALSHLGADRVELIEVDQFNCAGMFYAMASAERMLEAGQITEALIFAGDCLSDWPLAERYLPGCTLLGDGYALLRLSLRPGGIQISRIATRNYPDYAGGLDGPAEEMARFNRAQLQIITEALDQTGHDARRDALFPHNINGLCWRLFSRMTGQPKDRVHDGLVREIGHCCNADPFLVLDRALKAGTAVDGTILSIGMAGFVGVAAIRNEAALAQAA